MILCITFALGWWIGDLRAETPATSTETRLTTGDLEQVCSVLTRFDEAGLPGCQEAADAAVDKWLDDWRPTNEPEPVG